MEDTNFLESGTEATHFQVTGASTDGSCSAQGLSANFDAETWQAIEQKLSQSDIDVLKVLVACGFGTDSDVEYTLYSIGDESYRQLRSTLQLQLKRTKTSLPIPLSLTLGEMLDITPVAQTGKGTKKVKPLSKAEQIKQKNSADRIKKSVSDILATFKTDFTDIFAVSINAGIASHNIEIRGIALLYACAWLNFHREAFNVEEHYAKVFDIIATTQKFVNICEHVDTHCESQLTGATVKPSSTMIEDLKRWIVHLRNVYVKHGVPIFNWENIQRYAPQIFVQSEYQKILPQLYVKLRRHQTEIVNIVRDHIDTGVWAVYDAMIGSGKTSAEVALAALVSYLRISNPRKYGKLRLLSVCNSESVRLDLSQKMYNAATTFPDKKLHFAISYITTDSQRKTKAKIVKNNACPSDSDIVTVIASPAVGKMILDENDKLDDDSENKYQYILFVDEPTMGADNLSSSALYDNVLINHVSPYITINSSATFPNIGMLNTITTDFFSRHPTARSARVYSDEISIGCDIRTLSGEIVVPHLGATNSTQLREIVRCVENCAFLGKTYTPSVVDSLYKRMIEHNIHTLVEIPNVPVLFTNIDNLGINCVRRVAIQLLTALVSVPDELILAVCATTIADDEEEEEEDDHVAAGFTFSSNPSTDDITSNPIEYSKLGTTQNYRLQGQTLIAHPNPEEFVLRNFGELIDQVYASETNEVVSGGNISTFRYKSTGDAMRRYSAKFDAWEKKIDSIEKNATSPDDKDAKLNEHDKIKPVFPFPEWGHIGTDAHNYKYARSHREKIVKSLVRPKLNVPNLTSSKKIINVDDRILTALYCGIAIYSTETVRCKVYLSIVLQLASAGALAYVVADSSICFGTNYPFFNVIITEEFSQLHSMLVLFQVMGRAGRPGKSPKALIIVPNSVALRIINFVTTSAEADCEARNMEEIFRRQKVAFEEDEEKRIAQLVAKATRRVPVVSQLTVIRPSSHVEEKQEQKTESVPHIIVPISDVPDGIMMFAPESSVKKTSQLKNGDWRSTQSNPRDNSREEFRRDSRSSTKSSGGEWTRGVPQEHTERPPRRDERPRREERSSTANAGAGTGKYIPPAMRKDTNQEQEKQPRHKQQSKYDESAWKRGSK